MCLCKLHCCPTLLLLFCLVCTEKGGIRVPHAPVQCVPEWWRGGISVLTSKPPSQWSKAECKEAVRSVARHDKKFVKRYVDLVHLYESGDLRGDSSDEEDAHSASAAAAAASPPSSPMNRKRTHSSLGEAKATSSPPPRKRRSKSGATVSPQPKKKLLPKPMLEYYCQENELSWKNRRIPDLFEIIRTFIKTNDTLETLADEEVAEAVAKYIEEHPMPPRVANKKHSSAVATVDEENGPKEELEI